jgi:phosphoribosylformylglycinamidine synthase
VKPLGEVPHSTDIAADLLKLMGSPDLASRRWIWEQYDHMVGADTVQRPGGDAAVVRVHGTQKALAISTDVTPRYCYADPYEGGKQAIAECYRNLCAVGATPLASPMPQLRQSAAAGDHGAAGGLPRRAWAKPAARSTSRSSPATSPSTMKARPPAAAARSCRRPAIGGVGLLKDWQRSATIRFKREGEWVFVIGNSGDGHLGQSLWLREIGGQEAGSPPPVDLAAERAAGELVRRLVDQELVTAVHDVADGGILVAAAEMALAGNMGLSIEGEWFDGNVAARLFGEDQGRYIVATTDTDALARAADEAELEISFLGRTGGKVIANDDGGLSISLGDLRRTHEAFFPKLMGSDLEIA